MPKFTSSKSHIFNDVLMIRKSGTPVNAVAASGTLTISGVAKDGETVTIGADVYEFAADEAQTVTSGRIAVDITSYATKAQGTLSMATNPSANDTLTIGTTVYTFKASASVAGEVTIGADASASQVNLVAAINGTDGLNTAHALVSAADFAANDCVITALVGGTAGNAIATTETFTAVGNVFDAATLGTTVAGTDCSAANAVTAIVAASSSGVEYVTLADGAGDTVVVTADYKGTLANSIATTETMANGAFGAATLAGGVDGTVGTIQDLYIDNTNLYFCTADNDIHTANWKKIAYATA